MYEQIIYPILLCIKPCVSFPLWLTCCLILTNQDALLDKHKVEDTFGEGEFQDTGRPIKSLLVIILLGLLNQKNMPLFSFQQGSFFSLLFLFEVTNSVRVFFHYSCLRFVVVVFRTKYSCWVQVVISWACLLILGALKFLQWSSLLSSWKGISFTAIGLAIVTVLMHILIKFSQSERSTPAKVAPAKPKNGGESSEPGRHKHH